MSVSIYRKIIIAAIIIAAVFSAGSLSGCETKPSNELGTEPSDTAIESSTDPTTSSDVAATSDSQQDLETVFLQIEPAILKATQNVTYIYGNGELSFTIGKDTAYFPSDDVSSIFNSNIGFMPSGIFVSQNKVAVARRPDVNSIVITYSDDNGKSWQDSDIIQLNKIPDHATSEATFWDVYQEAAIMSLYVDFPSKTMGFLFVGSGTMLGTQYTRALLKTTDGGKTWNLVNSNIVYPSLPVTGMHFINELSGFIVQSNSNAPIVEVRCTTDSGANWSVADITMPPGLCDDVARITAFAPYYAANQLVLPVFIRPDKLIYFTSQDQGATWKYDSTIDIGIDQFLTEPSVLSPSVVSPQTEYTAPMDFSIPSFQGTVVRGGLPLLDIPNSEWEQAKHDFESVNPSMKDTTENLKLSDLTVSTLTDNWQGMLENEPFSLNVYFLQEESHYLLMVSKYGNNPVKITISVIIGFQSVFAFYGNNVWIMHEAKGIGESFNLITGEWEKSPLEQSENLITDFGQLFIDLSSIKTEARQTGAEWLSAAAR